MDARGEFRVDRGVLKRSLSAAFDLLGYIFGQRLFGLCILVEGLLGHQSLLASKHPFVYVWIVGKVGDLLRAELQPPEERKGKSVVLGGQRVGVGEDEHQGRRLRPVVIVYQVDFGRDVLVQGAGVRTGQRVADIALNARDWGFDHYVAARGVVVLRRIALVAVILTLHTAFFGALRQQTVGRGVLGICKKVDVDQSVPGEAGFAL